MGKSLDRDPLDALQAGNAIVRRKSRASVEEILAIADRVSAEVKGPYLDHGRLLYDDSSEPK